MSEVVTIRLVGCGEELKTISAAKLIRERACIDLLRSKTLLEELMEGRCTRIQIHGRESAEQFVHDAARYGLIAEIE